MKIIECPRDAMQGLHDFIPTAKKAEYINQLLKVGFDTIDFGSFVSPKAIPQMRDTAEVFGLLDLSHTKSKLLAIVANTRGAIDASLHTEINYLGFPLSLSETFQQRNTNKSIADALESLLEIQDICVNDSKKLVVYLSMGFGNPYGDPYEMDFVSEFVYQLDQMQIGIISLADTIGVSNPQNITDIFQKVAKEYPHIEFGVHLHSLPHTAMEKLEAAFTAGCRRMDGALLGIGGCPMATDDLTGNIATEQILALLQANDISLGLNIGEWEKSVQMARALFQ